MANHPLANLALLGILSASVSACGEQEPTQEEKAQIRESMKEAKIKRYQERMAAGIRDEDPPPASAGLPKVYQDLHGCAGKNSCKGFGGCKVSAEKLAKLAKDKGVTLEEAGEAHACAGLNACKGLGGCHVTQEKFDVLREKKKAAEKENAAEKE